MFLFILCFFLFPSGHLSGNQKAPEPWSGGGGWDVRGHLSRPPRAPAEVVLALREAARGCGCQVRHAGPFLLCCSHGAAGSKVTFQAEVCQLSVGPAEANGVRYTRLWGPPSPSGTSHRRSLKRWSSEGTGRRPDSETSPHYIRHYSELTLTHPPMCYRLKTTSDPSSS